MLSTGLRKTLGSGNYFSTSIENVATATTTAKRGFGTYPLLGEFVASSHLADLVGFVVPARGAIAAVVLPLAAYAIAASFPLFLHGFFWRVVLRRRRLLGWWGAESPFGTRHGGGGAHTGGGVGGIGVVDGGGGHAGHLAAVLRA